MLPMINLITNDLTYNLCSKSLSNYFVFFSFQPVLSPPQTGSLRISLEFISRIVLADAST